MYYEKYLVGGRGILQYTIKRGNYKYNWYQKSGLKDRPNALPKSIGPTYTQVWQLHPQKKEDPDEIQQYKLSLEKNNLNVVHPKSL